MEISTNLKTALQALICVLLLALPFDNAMFHFTALLVLAMALLTMHEVGSGPLIQSLITNRYPHYAIAGVWGVMLLSNFVNDLGEEAWIDALCLLFVIGSF